MIADDEKTEYIEVKGRPGSKLEVGHSERRDDGERLIRLYMTGTSGRFSPYSSLEVAPWSLDALNYFAIKHWGYEPPSAEA